MVWILIVVVLVAIAGAGAIVWMRRRPEPRSRSAAPPTANPPLVLRVELPADGKCCAAVREIAESRFEEGAAPSLPLAACTMKESCPCLYRSVPDRRRHVRRSGEERRKAIRFDPEHPPRRKSHGRRKSERTKWF